MTTQPTARSVASDTKASYVQRLEHRAQAWRAQLPAVRETATHAAAKVIDGGHLYFAGPQKSFAPDACGRSGGLMLAKWYAADAKLDAKDTILAAVAGNTDDAELTAILDRAAAASTTVILFGPAPAKLPTTRPVSCQRLPVTPFDDLAAESNLSIESISNVIGEWTWIAEFVAACVRQGKMPCVYESYRMPGGTERAAVLGVAPFHAVSNVTPEAADGLSTRYLDGLIAALHGLDRDDQINCGAMSRAEALIREAHRVGGTIRVTHDGHMYPVEIAVPQNPAWFTLGKPDDVYASNDVGLNLSYQPYPWDFVKKASAKDAALIITSAHVPPAEFAADPTHIYIDPHWQVGDASTELPGYDAKMFPISGIMQGTIYWRLVERATR